MASSLVSGQRFPVPGLPSQDRCLVMGVVNVTPDSFSDGGAWLGADAAVAHGLELAAQGADIVDVGGESTRPGAQRISAEEEIRRVQLSSPNWPGPASRSAWIRCGRAWPSWPWRRERAWSTT